ncbi:MAG: ABC transporter substrate-binding protein [Acidimicrobiia bacterium]|nr:ABC transporter substrate-binding protein [Acidimicrobiia bacterium]
MKQGFRLIALLAAIALVAAACGDDTSDTTTAPSNTSTTADAGGTTTTTEEMMTGPTFDIGVTEEPCEGGSPDRGCILLGSVTDQTGTFAAASPGLLAGHELFWARVNASGGIGGLFDVDILDSAIVDNGFDNATHVEAYQGIRDDVLALAESLGTTQSLAALPDYIDDNMVAAPATWWSGWNYPESDAGLILEAGASYCVEAMNAVDFAVSNFPTGAATVGIVHFPGDFGEDYLAGVKLAAAANNLDVVYEQVTLPIALDPSQQGAIDAVLENYADVTFLVMGPNETATIVGTVAATWNASGTDPRPFIGAGPTWNSALLASPAGAAFEGGIYFNSAPWGPWATDTPGHAALRASAEAGGAPASNFVSAGWVEQYPLKATLEAAVAAGDITRAGVVAAANSLGEVDYEGMVETVADYSGNSIITSSVVSAVDAAAPDGLTLLAGPFTGPTAAAHDYTGPCTG